MSPGNWLIKPSLNFPLLVLRQSYLDYDLSLRHDYRKQQEKKHSNDKE